MKPDVDAVIVGGGVAGLSAAYYLERAGRSVVVLEGSERVGGLVKTEKKDGFTLEQGANVLVGKPDIKELVAELGLSPVYPHFPRYRQHVWSHMRGAPVRVPKSPQALAGTSLISLVDKLLLPVRLASAKAVTPAGDDESIAQFLGRIVGSKAVRELIDPAFRGIFGGSVHELSARMILPELWQHVTNGKSLLAYMRAKSPRKVFVLQGGQEELARSLHTRLRDVQLSCRVKAINSTPAGYRVISETSEVTTKAVFVAVAGSEGSALLSDDAEPAKLLLSSIRFAGITVLHFAVPRESPVLEQSFGMLYPEDREMLGVMFNSELFPHVAPEGEHLLTVCVPAAVEDVVGVASRRLRADLGFTDPRLLGVMKWPGAIPQYTVGYQKVVDEMKALENKSPGLYFIGADRGGVGVPDRVRRAREATSHWLNGEKHDRT